ncbi:MAG: fumarylacetoacetate hydrolase family protein [Bacteroidota bacterium]|jgi:5-carboxymethyl-2-hydroxymuconate isomerase
MNLEFTNGNNLRIGTIYGIGKNYSDHIKEMGGAAPEEPLIFIKPSAAYLPDGGTILLPAISNNVHHEVELVIVIGKECVNIKKEDAYKYIAGYGIGIDVTMRDIQAKAKKEGNPWAVAKGFATSAPLSKIIPASEFNEQEPLFDIELKVNGVTKQKVSTKEMMRTASELIEYLSEVFGLYPGDCIYTGTPEGVGKISDGDELVALLNGKEFLKVFAKDKK